MEELDRKDSKPEHVKDILARMVPELEKQRSESRLNAFKGTSGESNSVMAIIALRAKDNSPEARKSASGKR